MSKKSNTHRASKRAKAEAKRAARAQAKADKEAESKAIAVAKAEEVDGLVAQLKALVDGACERFASDMHDAAELAFCLQDKYALTQFQIGARIGRSQQWVSGVLIWRSKGYPDTAFGPQAKKARGKLLPVTGKVEPDPQVGMPLGPTLALLPDNSIVKITGNDVDTEASAEARKAAMTEDSEPCPTEVPATAEAPTPESKRELTPEQKSDDALAAFKAMCDTQCPLMTEADLKQARIYLMEQRWKPRGSIKAA